MNYLLSTFLFLSITFIPLTYAVVFNGKCNYDSLNYLKNVTIDNLLVYDGNKTISQYYVIATYGSGYQDKMCVTEQLVKINSTYIQGARQYLIRGDKTLQTQRALHTIEKTKKPGFFTIRRQEYEGHPYYTYDAFILSKDKHILLFYLCRDLSNGKRDVTVFAFSSTQSGITNVDYEELQQKLKRSNINMNFIQFVENGVTVCQI
ncbi:uncharacterized protein LOC123297383 [Chrysoperla carnea]|uniref:uncharacterized protein LOC123297383 n=1 Tax=Chrysoperla carnea TaxID=189513 RepID=UPI001D094D95|nr:uncharacterized protein LOC123297383 [Chrysoperla carnea]